MKSTIGVYEDHQAAIAAVTALKDAGIPQKNISIVGQAHDDRPLKEELNTDGLGLDSDDIFAKPAKVAAKTMGVSVVVGPILGALAGLGLLAIPGLGLIVGAGALAGAVAGLDAGIIGGGIISAIRIAGINKQHESDYQQHLKEGHYLVIIQGSDEEAKQAHDLLENRAQHLLLQTHG